METGIIKFYKEQERWGKITLDATSKDIYFKFKDVKPELGFMLEFKRYEGEPLTFDISESSYKAGEKQAVEVNIDLNKRKLGKIYEFDTERGFGKIEDYSSKQKTFFHHSGIRKAEWKKDKFERIEIGEPVIYSLGSNEKGPQAIEIVKVDDRMFIEEFANFKNLNQSLTELKLLAEHENWDYIQRPTKRIPVLLSYINQTCKRIVTQNKLVKGKSSKDGKEYCYFNTCLVTPQQDEIFAYFVKNPKYIVLQTWGVQEAEWDFLEFNTDQSVYRRYFADIPEIATYFSEAEVADLIFDTRIRIIPDRDHLIKRKARVDSDKIKGLDDDAFIEEIKDAIELAKRRVKRNYKTAIPHFYENKIQFLLPLSVKSNKADAIGALVVNKNENIYEAHTILSLDQAYNNARLLAKPDREWLNP